jgi:hypothetical protein
MTETSEITPGERRELRSVVRGQFKVLRAEVDRRKEELHGEIEAELLRRYREQDDAIAAARAEVAEAQQEYLRAIERIGRSLKDAHPELEVEAGRTSAGTVRFGAADPHRQQEHRAAVASIPSKIGDAKLRLDRAEQDMLRELSAGALQTDEARAFLAKIPSVGELVPRAVLAEIEARLEGAS